MSETAAVIEQVFKTVEQFDLDQLDLLRERIEQSRRQRELLLSHTFPAQAQELFQISFDRYSTLVDDERDALVFRAYKVLGNWIEQELKVRHAQWMLVCGGEILDFSSRLLDYPSSEKLKRLGKSRGLIPFVFIRAPIVEESSWAFLAEEDYYPTLPISFSRFGSSSSEFKASKIEIEADFDTGASHLLLDHDEMVAHGVIAAKSSQQAHYRPHLGEYYSCYLLPVNVGFKGPRNHFALREFGALFVRNWRQSPLCLVNPSRRALVGRNLLLEFPLRIELDGASKATRILSERRPRAKKSQRK
ncbi:MAG: hypothetical protein AAB354_10915 [candidate division KSB1 bacterium]